ncbi:MAG: Rne/Rng family ribonuclease [Actinomycetota bacterium]|nr:Rne/Rng family ribonuclease [Actinomycetota bacterium]
MSEQSNDQRDGRHSQVSEAVGTAPSTLTTSIEPAGPPPSAPVAPRKPQIGDSRPAPSGPTEASGRPAMGTSQRSAGENGEGGATGKPRRRRRGGRGRGGGGRAAGEAEATGTEAESTPPPTPATPTGSPRTRSRPAARAVGVTDDDEPTAETRSSRRRRGRERKGRPVGRYLMCVHAERDVTQIAVLEGRSLIEHHVARNHADANQIDGNIYRGRVKNVLPGMEAAFVDIGTPKNAVLYWGDVHAERDDSIEREPGATRIEHLLRPGQTIVCQVTKNPIGLKGARLTEEVSLPGRFVVLVPNSTASGISKRLDDNERKRLRKLLDDVRPEGHGIIVRTAAEGVSAQELRRDVEALLERWHEIEEKARHLPAPALLHAEPHLALRAIREEFTEEYRGVIIDDPDLYDAVRAYVADIDPALADRVELYDPEVEALPLFERHHVHEQLHKALDRKVWLPSGGSLIIERTEALTVIDVNTGKNVGSSSLEETVFRNNLEAAEEIARQLRLRDIGGIIVIDFIDMEVKGNRQEVVTTLRQALMRDKTPTQVCDISELGLIEMTRKRVGEGLVESLSETCPVCKGRGIVFPDALE